MAATANLLHVMPDQADMDDDTYELALKILLDDARQMVSQPNAKGKQREDAISDQDFAFNIYAQEIETATARIKDHRVSQGLHNALSTDLEIVARYDHENQMAQYDREYALALHQGREPPPPPRPQPVHHQTTGIANRVPARDAEIKQDQKRPLKRERRSPSPCGSLHGDNNNDEGDLFFGGKRLKTGESSYWAASRQVLPKQQPVVQKRPCTSCTDPIPETRLVRAPCSHEYCHDCLRTLVRKGMLDESLFPPQCCRQAIPADKLAEFLDHSLMTRYHEKEIELSTVNRIYCHKPDCAAFILPALVENDEALCVACGTTTCIHCKRAMHSGDCPLDNELQRVLQVAQQEGWRRCQRCNAMVELNQGCFHMTCRCRAEFCYTCGAQWKTCNCPLWEERRIIDRAAEIDQRQHGGRNDQEDPQQGERMDEIMDRLRGNQNCNHGGQWRRRPGRHMCEGCHHVLPHFIYECADCQLAACRMCRFHRV